MYIFSSKFTFLCFMLTQNVLLPYWLNYGKNKWIYRWENSEFPENFLYENIPFFTEDLKYFPLYSVVQTIFDFIYYFDNFSLQKKVFLTLVYVLIHIHSTHIHYFSKRWEEVLSMKHIVEIIYNTIGQRCSNYNSIAQNLIRNGINLLSVDSWNEKLACIYWILFEYVIAT